VVKPMRRKENREEVRKNQAWSLKKVLSSIGLSLVKSGPARRGTGLLG
jgi:hypothetical protein